jgi:hypothetical protein
MLRELNRFRVSGNVIFRKVCGCKEGEVGGGQSKFHNECHYLYSPANIMVIRSRRMRLAGHIVCIGVRRFRVLLGIAAGTRALRRSRRRWEDNIKVGSKDTGLWRVGDHWLDAPA